MTGKFDPVFTCVCCGAKLPGTRQELIARGAATIQGNGQILFHCNADQAAKRLKSKVSHPCTHHRIGGWCGLSAIHSQCQYSKTKALKPAPIGCSEAIAKKRMVKK